MSDRKIPKIVFRDVNETYHQRVADTDKGTWVSYVSVEVKPNGWVAVMYSDGVHVMYPPAAITMILGYGD
jgi:hypothetical protein